MKNKNCGMMTKQIRYINSDGEVVSDKTSEFVESMNSDGYRFPSQKLGFRCFDEVSFPKEMTDSEIGKMTKLSKLMVGSTNLLGYSEKREILKYKKDELAEYLNINKRVCSNFLKNMERLRLIKIIDNGYYINPAYFMSTGQRLSLELFIHFQEEIQHILPRWVVDDFIMMANRKAVKGEISESESCPVSTSKDD